MESLSQTWICCVENEGLNFVLQRIYRVKYHVEITHFRDREYSLVHTFTHGMFTCSQTHLAHTHSLMAHIFTLRHVAHTYLHIACTYIWHIHGIHIHHSTRIQHTHSYVPPQTFTHTHLCTHALMSIQNPSPTYPQTSTHRTSYTNISICNTHVSMYIHATLLQTQNMHMLYACIHTSKHIHTCTLM